jgi:hypothetical protein
VKNDDEDDGWPGEVNMVAELLHLYWEDGIALCVGVVSLQVSAEVIEQFWEFTRERETVRFWFG